MHNMGIHGVFKSFNFIYHHCYPIYKPLYFAYKRVTDRKRIAFLLKHIRKGARVLDLGANIGFYTVLFSRIVGENGTVFSFEPDLLNFARLRQNTRKLTNVRINNLACGDKSEKLRLYLSADMNVDHQTYDIGEGRVHREVSCIAIDDYFQNDETIDFVKIDVQGYDYFAIKGMTKTINRSNEVGLLGEFWPYGLTRAGTNPASYLTLLNDLGFGTVFFDLRGNYGVSQKINDKSFYSDFFGTKPSRPTP